MLLSGKGWPLPRPILQGHRPHVASLSVSSDNWDRPRAVELLIRHASGGAATEEASLLFCFDGRGTEWVFFALVPLCFPL